MTMRTFCIILTILVSSQFSGSAGDWAFWRGPNRDSTSAESFDPEKLSGKPDPIWHINVQKGYSAVCVKGNYLFTMGNDGTKDTVYCLNAKTGQEIWSKQYPCPKGGAYPGPRATPVLDGARLYTVSRQGHVHCWDPRTGKIIWQRDLVKDFKVKLPKWAIAGSVRVVGSVVLVNANSYGIGLDKMNGKKIWTSPAGTGGYAVPRIYETNGKARAAIFGEKHLYGVDVQTGKKLWSYPWQTRFNVNAADPEIHDAKIFITSGYGTGCALLDISSGQPRRLWQNREIASHFSSCYIKAGAIYGLSGNAGRPGHLTCLDMQTGQKKWSAKTGFGSFIIADGKFIVLTERGDVIVAAVQSDSYKEIARGNVMNPKGRCWTMPILADGRLFCRSSSGELVAIDVSP